MLYGKYRRQTIIFTKAVVSYTDAQGKRHKEELIKFTGLECYKNFELYKAILKHETSYQMYKPFVHEITQTYYWEE